MPENSNSFFNQESTRNAFFSRGNTGSFLTKKSNEDLNATLLLLTTLYNLKILNFHATLFHIFCFIPKEHFQFVRNI